MLKRILLSLAVGGLVLRFGVAQIAAQATGSIGDPYQVRTTSTIYIAPPATSSALLSFSGIALSRYQPDAGGGVDPSNGALYTVPVEVEGEDEWAVTLYNQEGNLQMVEATVAGELKQVFALDYQDTNVFKNLYSADLDLLDMGIEPPTDTNIKTDERIFRLKVDYLYRTPNNVEWRFSADPFFYKVSTDVFAPTTEIYTDCDSTAPGSCTPTRTGDINYNDENFKLQLYAVDPDSVSGEVVVSTGLLRYRYSWVEDTTNGMASCPDYWQSASGSAVTWQNANNTGQLNADGLLYQNETTLADVANATPSAQLFCFQVEDNVGNIANDEAHFNLVMPKYISLDCGDYLGKLYNTCTGSGCDNLLLNPIAMWGRSALENGAARNEGEKTLGNTISCDVVTNSQSGYELQVAAQISANMTRQGGSDAIVGVGGSLATPSAWLNPIPNSQWGLRIHSASGTEIYDGAKWGVDSYDGGKWASIATTNQTVYQRSSNLNLSPTHMEVAAEDEAVMQFGVEVKDTDNLPKGRYEVDLVFTAVTIDN